MNEPGLGMTGGSATHFDTLAISLDLFRKSSLPSHGKKLLMNLISVSNAEAAGWWSAQTSEEERAQWAVIDLHHYIAWPGVDWCSNSSVSLDALKQRIATTDAYTWQFSARNALGLNGTSALVAMSEFSGSAHEDTTHSCSPNNVAFGDEAKALEVVRYFVQQQIAQSHATDVVDFFWKWHFPYNSNFRNEWSLKYILSSGSRARAPVLVEA